MRLITKAIQSTIPALYSTEDIPERDKLIVCKFFAIGSGWTWYVTEGESVPGDYIFYGLVCGHEREWGYFTLNELLSVKWMGIPGIERDVFFQPVKVGECKELGVNHYCRLSQDVVMSEDEFADRTARLNAKLNKEGHE